MLRIWGRNIFYPILHPLTWLTWHKHQPIVETFLDFLGLDVYYGRPEVEFKTWKNFNGYCYCPVGSQTTWRIAWLGFGLILWCNRDPLDRTQPCSCEEALHEYHKWNNEEFDLGCKVCNCE